jgi:hypothetical protein
MMPSLTTSSVSKPYQDTRLRFLSNLCIQFIYFVLLFSTVTGARPGHKRAFWK